MGSTRRITTMLVVTAALAAAMIGSGALAEQQDPPAPAVALPAVPEDVLERLGDLEPLLPEDVLTAGIELDAETTWGTFGGDAGSVNAVLETLEADLRQLFVVADDIDGPAAEAIALIARGWLDIWHGTAGLAAHESNDLAFPVGTVSDDEVATGADELRGSAETGLALVLQGRQRHLEGYMVLRELGEAPAGIQVLFDRRAAAAETFDTEIKPLLAVLLSKTPPSVAVPGERFVTRAPGVEPRANSMTLACLDRELLAEAGGIASEELLPELDAGSVDRLDCPDLLGPVDGEEP